MLDFGEGEKEQAVLCKQQKCVFREATAKRNCSPSAMCGNTHASAGSLGPQVGGKKSLKRVFPNIAKYPRRRIVGIFMAAGPPREKRGGRRSRLC